MKTEPPAKWVLPPSGYQSPGDDTGLRLSLVFYLLHSLNSNFAQVLEILEAFFFFVSKKDRESDTSIRSLGDKSSFKSLWKNTVSQEMEGVV